MRIVLENQGLETVGSRSAVSESILGGRGIGILDENYADTILILFAAGIEVDHGATEREEA